MIAWQTVIVADCYEYHLPSVIYIYNVMYVTVIGMQYAFPSQVTGSVSGLRLQG